MKLLKKQIIKETNLLYDYYYENNKDMKNDINNNSLFKKIKQVNLIMISVALMICLSFNAYIINVLSSKDNRFYENQILLNEAVGQKYRILSTYHNYTKEVLDSNDKTIKKIIFMKNVDLDKYIKDLEASIKLEKNIENVQLISLLKEELSHAEFVKEKLENFDILKKEELLSLGLK